MQHPIQRRALLALALGALANGARASPTSWPTPGWQVDAPEAHGMDGAALLRLAERGRASGVDSYVVARHGVIVHEGYFGGFRQEQRHVLNSATKGIVAALLALAVDQGRVAGPHATLLEHFAGRPVAFGDPRKQQVTLQHLLDMQSGLSWTESLAGGAPVSMWEMRRSTDWVQFVLDRPMAGPPGQGFNYNSGNSHLLSAVLTAATGMPADDYARRHLFGPLGITDIAWPRDPQGIATGGFGLEMTTRDMARIGLLMLRGGQWEDRQLLPAAWVQRVRQPRVAMELSPSVDFRYGEQWWALPSFGAHMAVGYNRQVIMFLPEHDLVFASTGRRNWNMVEMLTALRACVTA